MYMFVVIRLIYVMNKNHTMIQYAITKYNARIGDYSSRTEPTSRAGTIVCRGENGERIAIHFMTTLDTMTSRGDETTKRGWIHAPVDHMPIYLDILRNESPVYCAMQADMCFIFTGNEPVREDE